jgi:hypothetical protein
MAEGTAPALLFVVGPPAVGKMTVGREIAERTGLRLFHNHMSAEPVLPFFDFGSPGVRPPGRPVPAAPDRGGRRQRPAGPDLHLRLGV